MSRRIDLANAITQLYDGPANLTSSPFDSCPDDMRATLKNGYEIWVSSWIIPPLMSELARMNAISVHKIMPTRVVVRQGTQRVFTCGRRFLADRYITDKHYIFKSEVTTLMDGVRHTEIEVE